MGELKYEPGQPGVSKELLEEIQFSIESAAGHAIFLRFDDYDLLSLRQLNPTHDGLSVGSFFVLFLGDSIFTVRDGIDEISIAGFLELLQAKIADYSLLVSGLVEQVDIIEDSLFSQRKSRNFAETWFRIRQELSIMDRSLVRNSQTLGECFSAHSAILEPEWEELNNQIQLIKVERRNCDTEMRRLESLHQFYTSIKNDKMNTHIYLLALVSGVFLPLNLVVGFFGMNTENLFFGNDPNGTWNVVGVLFGLFCSLLVGLPLGQRLYGAIAKLSDGLAGSHSRS